jgi:hypothetical protein
MQKILKFDLSECHYLNNNENTDLRIDTIPNITMTIPIILKQSLIKFFSFRLFTCTQSGTIFQTSKPTIT